MLKILLIKRGAIGDLLLATPLIRQLKQKLHCQIDIVVGKSASGALENNPYINQKFILADRDFSLSASWRLAKQLLLLRDNYDYVFVLDKHWYFNLLAKIVGAPVVGYVREKISKCILNYSVNYDNVERYHGLYYLDLLRASGLAPANYEDLGLDLVVTQSDKQSVDNFLANEQLYQFVIIVNSGGNNAYEQAGLRMLPEVKMVEFLNELLRKGKPILLAGSSIDFEHNQDYIDQLNVGNKIRNVAGKFNLAASSYLFSRAQHCYMTDCGAMHLAVAQNLGNRLSVFFGPTNPAHILPLNYLEKSAYWQDQATYHPNYQLNGNQQNPEPKYFSKFDAKLILSKIDNC